ncbi:hypothetical protein [Oceanobacillus bengalensis]|uniref:LysM domain-containing protein n=1 Tax=Oceanobacillus bengalensis TaxID=1435466 RepID=A0A494Z5J6_9BACI|nr:hypothetical protein [Oceanobacillus bengalensis]RKQ17829.1 hypothetical protein D8M05_02795 [Oceanobacillus bengalensis]
MHFFKRMSLYIIILMLIASIYKDLSLGTANNKVMDIPANTETINHISYDIMQIKISPGDTLLSVVEGINSSNAKLNFDNLINDFKALNPNVDPYKLEPNTFYYFPVYNRKETE